MGCYYHPAVPTAVLCRECGHEICSHCSIDSLCPGCRLGQAIKGAAQKQPVLTASMSANGAGARSASASAPGPSFSEPQRPSAPSRPVPTVVEEVASPEDRLLSALCYPLWPVAMIVLFLQSQRSKFLRFNVVQSLAVNALGVALYVMYAAAEHFPVIGWQSALVLPFAMPIWFFVDLYLAVKAYGGQSIKVPIAAEIAGKYAS